MGSLDTAKSWQDIRDAKKAEQASRIPSEWLLQGPMLDEALSAVDPRPYVAKSGLLSPEELEITELDATELSVKIAKRVYTSVQVATAFCKRCAIGQQLCNYLTEVMFLPAIEEAKKLDDYYRETGRVKGPLHGVPMTVKECFCIKGYAASNNYVSQAFQPSDHDSYLVQILRDAGAVIIAKTNTPQTMMCAETNNNLFGQTKNSVVSHLTCGGSSGGEGSVVAFRGSALGIGTDVGGSIRIPAAAQGIHGYKPTSGILPMLGNASSTWAGTNTGVPAVCGPLANSFRDVRLLINVVRSFQPWIKDPATIPGIFEIPTSTRRPVVGVIRQSALTPHPPVKRALEEAVTKLRAAGFEVREFTPPDFAEMKFITQELFTLDGLSYARQEMGLTGEPVMDSIVKLGLWKRKAKSQEETWAWNAKRIGFEKKMRDSWQAAGIDVALCPAGPHSAVPRGEWSNTMYTVCWNGVDYPGVIIPFTHVDPGIDRPYENFTPLSSFDADVDARLQALFDPELLKGAPVALQLVGRKWSDAQLLADVECIEAALQSA